MNRFDDTTELLRGWTGGDRAAGEALFSRLYDEIHALASRRRRGESASSTLQTTALVHELYLRLVDQKHASWRDRGQFFAVASRMMRRILVDHARTVGAEKRGGRARTLSISEVGDVAFGDRSDELLAVDACLLDLERIDPDKARLVELRFFGGLSLEDTAEALGLSRATVVRQWRLTKGWLHRQLAEAGGDAPSEP